MPNWRARARQYATAVGLDPDVFERQIQQESGFNPNARSPAGAIGIAQIMPGTARGWGVDPTNPDAALRAAARNMAKYVKQFGSIKNALIAYNAGPGAVGHGLPAETQNYLQTILHGKSGGGGLADGAGGIGTPPVSSQQPQQNIFSTIASLNAPFADSPLEKQIQHGWDLLASLRGQDSSSASSANPTGLVAQAGGGGNGVGEFEGKKVAAWILPELEYARRHGWKGSVTSGFRSRAEQERIYNSGVRPAAKPGTSNHEGDEFPRGAVDVSDAETLARILKRRRSRLVWAGSRDPVHFSHPHGGSY